MRFNGTQRREVLNRELLDSVLEARVVVDESNDIYNFVRPHSGLGGLTPADVADRLSAEAAHRGVDPETLVGEILAEQLPAPRTLGFASLGRSTSGKHAADDEDMLADGFGR